MIKNIFTILLLTLSLVSPEVYARDKSRHILIIKTGNFGLNNTEQSSSRKFTKKSKEVYGAEYEWRLWKGLSIGGEYFHYTNDFTATSPYETDTTAYLFNLKYYFNHQGSFQPFLGIGQGFSIISPTGETFIGSHSGFTSQFTAGLTYQFKYVGIYTEYKVLNAKLKDHFCPIVLSNIYASGKGLLVGINIMF